MVRGPANQNKSTTMTMQIVREKQQVALGSLCLDSDPPETSICLDDKDRMAEFGGFALQTVLTKSECEMIVRAAESGGFTFWDPEGEAGGRRRLRDAETVEFTDCDFAGGPIL